MPRYRLLTILLPVCIASFYACANGDVSGDDETVFDAGIRDGSTPDGKAPDGGSVDAGPCVKKSDTDDFDVNFTDDNCDGNDGIAGQCIFVSLAKGVDSADGTTAKPFKKIQAAIDFAATEKKGRSVCVGAETFKETIALKSGVNVFGGFDSTNGFVRSKKRGSTDIATSIENDTGTVVTAEAIDARTRLESVTIKATIAGTTADGASVYGVRAISGTALEIRACKITAGDAHAGLPGVKGEIFNTNATDGTMGSPASGSRAGAPAPACAVPGGKGGDGVAGNTNGGNGAKGAGTNGGNGGSGGGGTACIDGNGGDGGNGITATDGLDATIAGTAGPVGTLMTSVYTPAKGGDGADGLPGGGGGGGGGGGATRTGFVFCSDEYSGGGGSGGCGGEGGHGGKGGSGGGASFGVFVVAGTVKLDSNEIASGTGGAGGKGGDATGGQQGGIGGDGGAAGNKTGKGGRGGSGGFGGSGSGGGGGAGGPSARIAKGPSVTVTETNGKGAVGRGGAAGTGGFGAGAGPAGESGLAGTNVDSVEIKPATP